MSWLRFSWVFCSVVCVWWGGDVYGLVSCCCVGGFGFSGFLCGRVFGVWMILSTIENF